MKQISIHLVSATSESGNVYYGGEVLLDDKLIKFIPIIELNKSSMEAYLNLLRSRLSYVQRNDYEFVVYSDFKGNYSTYWSSVPGEQFYALHVKK